MRGILIAGYEASIRATHRLIGTEGVLEVLTERSMRLLNKGQAGWRVVEVPQGEQNEHILTALDVVRQLDEPGHRSFLNVDNAIQHT